MHVMLNPPPSKKIKIHQNLKIVKSNFLCNYSFGVFKHYVHYLQKEKNIFFIFTHAFPEKLALIIGSAFTQHYNVWRMLFVVLNLLFHRYFKFLIMDLRYCLPWDRALIYHYLNIFRLERNTNY